MKKIAIYLIASVVIMASCNKEKRMSKVIDESLSFAVKQYELMYDVMKEKPDQLPRTIDPEGKLRTENSRWWTSGFFPAMD